MKNMIDLAIKPIFRSHYRKMLLLYSSFTIIVVIVSSFILINFFNAGLSREAATSNNRLLTQIKISADAILSSIQSFINEGYLDMYRENSMYGFFSESYQLDTATLLKVHDRISTFAYDHEYIDSIYIYHKAFDTFLSSREGVVFSASQSDNYNRKYVDFDSVNNLMNSSRQYYWTSALENRSFWQQKPIISFAHSIPLFADQRDKRGGIVVNINERNFLQSINYLANSDYSLFVIDAAGEVVSSSGNAGLRTEDMLPLLNRVLSEPEGYTAHKSGKMTFGVSWVGSSMNDWKYVSLAPIQTINGEIFIARQFAMLCVALIILFSLFGVKIMTARLYRPMAKMEDTILKNQSLIRHKAISDMISGHNMTHREDINEMFKRVGGLPQYSLYCVATMEIEFLKKPSFEEREFILYDLIHGIDHFFGGRYPCLSISLNPNHVVTILNLEDYSRISEELGQLLQLNNQESGFKCNIAVSGTTDQMLNIPSLYADTRSFLRYGFVYGYGRLFTHEDIARYENNENYLDAKHLKQLKALLVPGKIPQVKQHLQEIVAYLQEHKLSYNYIQNCLLQILTLYIETVEEQRMVDSEMDLNKLLIKFNTMSSLEECLGWFHELTDRYGEQMQLKNETIDQEFMGRIKAYIDANIDREISLLHVAEHFGISSSHLSKIFKESMDVNFSKYTIDMKLKKAAEMFVGARRLKVSEVANALGYYNIPYFIAIFKEKYGVTPAKYGKSQMRPETDSSL